MSAQIPVIGQTVGTPNLPPRPRPPLEQTPDVGRGLEQTGAALEQAATGLTRILAVQARHQKTLDTESKVTDFTTNLQNAYLNAKTATPSDQWGATVNKAATDLQQKMLADPANAHIRNDLAEILPKIAGHMGYEASEAILFRKAR